ncbi:MAG: hypothetical protein K6E50_01605 [Lachnospiraceae bacterium]|nr:hypothetical protein [Lachnospiraceae bacterium]
MREKWNKLDAGAKVRMIILALIALWCAYCVIAYSREIYETSIANGTVDTKNMGSVTVDGSDFTPIAQFLGSSFNSLFVFVIIGAYSLVILAICGLPEFFYWLILIRKRSVIQPEESELATYIVGLGAFFGVVGGIVACGFHTRFAPVWFTFCWLIPAFLLLILPFRRRMRAGAPPTDSNQVPPTIPPQSPMN